MFEHLEAIIVFHTEAIMYQIEATDPLAKVLLNQELEGDLKANKIASVLNSPNVNMLKNVEPLDRVLAPSHNISIKEAL